MAIIEKDKVVSLTYELRLNNQNGEVIESLNESSPLTFLFRSGRLLPKFEDYLEGLTTGQKFDFNLPCEDAYGDLNEDAIVDVPVQAFEINGKIDENLLKPGNAIPMQDSSGNRLNGIVKEINDETVTMDFNHPLAGQHLYFSGKITEVRDATEEELNHGHIHSGGCSSCDSCGDEGNSGCC
jgi:FKBP-type peptidyl-prolyl cis-trans isomerase SlyD